MAADAAYRDREEDVSRWAQIEKMRVATWHVQIHPTKGPLHVGGFGLIHTKIW